MTKTVTTLSLLFFAFLYGCNRGATEVEPVADVVEPRKKPVYYSDDAFRMAAYEGKLDIVERAIESGIEVDCVDASKGHTALLMAAYNGHAPVVRFLINHDAKVDARDNEGKTPLIHACSGPFAETAEMLIDAGADVNAADSTEGFTPLMTAAALGEKEVVELLLEKNANVATTDDDGDTALSHAQNAGHSEIVTLLEKSSPAP
ncbi:ankyrin repeat domain-containing protein [Rubripirellula amarantea]|uniref:Ankyrin repeats (3 copies) n=1 Tax=Rubripirellula amarantea TaxID=2527999 RepID=A0A5C5WF76_9BACT|nr:ankyrin repeat domain-containing protein [Rubripirellula amarantea]MDA8745372.1 ankyrin repeat domain-containing protein [Rubripirellula amarantea]TWT49197.1 Ankyrin repeats (3 copies) [Rubripirellula amarantea]